MTKWMPPQSEFRATEVWYSAQIAPNKSIHIQPLSDRPTELSSDQRSVLVMYLTPNSQPIAFCIQWLTPKPPPNHPDRQQVLLAIMRHHINDDNLFSKLIIGIGHAPEDSRVTFDNDLDYQQ